MHKDIKYKLLNIVLILLIVIFVICKVLKSFPNDTFFTIAIGNQVLSNGIEKIDRLVWHNNLEYTNSRWLFDIIIALFYRKFGFNGIYILTIIFAVFQSLLFYYILRKISNRKLLSFLFTLIIINCIENEFVARAQIVSFFLFLLEFYSIEKVTESECKKRYIAYLIIIPILLANMHASVFPMYFIFYLPYIAEFILSKLNLKFNENSKIIIQKRNIKKLIILFFIGILCGFIKPLYVHPFSDMIKANSEVAVNMIKELKPIKIIENIYFVFFIIITISIISFTKTKVRITDCLYILGFCLLSLYAIRCIYFFYLISSICIFRIVNDCLNEYNINIKLHNNYIKIFLSILSILLLISYCLKLMTSKMNENYIETQKYPIDAANYILDNLNVNNMRIWNHFNFGSYLEFKGIPVFIDSRSGMYTEEFNKDVTIFEDWANVVEGIVSYKKIFDKYEITHALLYNNELINLYIYDDSDWKQIYQDDIFSLYEKIK